MKKLLLLTLSLLFISLSTTFAGKQDFTLINKTGSDINEVYVSPHSSDDWEEDVMGKQTLDKGESVAITFSRASKEKDWDIKVVTKGGKELIFEKLNLLEVSKVTLKLEDGKPIAEYE